MGAKSLLSEAIQIGPWRIARKHLLFCILFGITIICFGIVILHTHIFSDEEEETEDENENEWGALRDKLSHGDWVMIVIMTLAGLLSIVAGFTCIFVEKNSPNRLSHSEKEQPVFSIQFDNRRRTTEATAPSFPEREISIIRRSNSNSNIQCQGPVFEKDHKTSKHYSSSSSSLPFMQHYLKTEEVEQAENEEERDESHQQGLGLRLDHQTSRDVQILNVQNLPNSCLPKTCNGS